ncbi:MIP/aquaporin family protein [Amylibacter sp. IMCC11727]|uniref:MIP/aquaporin family protein n=1 Tax=Amylibacter sp. IMCC11727 TaxID=3039851 RepID=UPI00244E0B14|nr:MIP/aquaporin family protein [Amylibacter sp. IMCC11727]WGI20460.1 aquaporin family protein [Amylibacter sp. IMCC11727]
MQRLLAEGLGTAFLLATVIGSGIMGETLADGNTAIALLGNTLPTGAILVVLITIFGPISGAHFNPAVTLAFYLRKEITLHEGAGFIIVQIIGGLLGVWAAHLMFDLDVLQVSQKMRAGPAQGFSELIASFGLVLIIFGGIRHKPDAVPMLVGLYITAAYWFTASTSFANPAVTIARMMSDTFAGITPASAPLFIAMQIIGAVAAFAVAKVLFPNDPAD